MTSDQSINQWRNF